MAALAAHDSAQFAASPSAASVHFSSAAVEVAVALACAAAAVVYTAEKGSAGIVNV